MSRYKSGRADPATAERLRDARIQAGVTREQAARACTCSVETVVNWESGNSEPRASDLRLLCKLYAAEPAPLLGLAS